MQVIENSTINCMTTAFVSAVVVLLHSKPDDRSAIGVKARQERTAQKLSAILKDACAAQVYRRREDVACGARWDTLESGFQPEVTKRFEVVHRPQGHGRDDS